MGPRGRGRRPRGDREGAPPTSGAGPIRCAPGRPCAGVPLRRGNRASERLGLRENANFIAKPAGLVPTGRTLTMARGAKSSGARAFKMYIDGKWVESEDRDTFRVVSPASGDVIATFPKGTAEDAKAAVEAAVAAQDRVRDMPIRERARLGSRVAG